MDSVISWLSSIIVPVALIATFGLMLRGVLKQRSAAFRAAVGVATLTSMAVFMIAPLVPVQASLPAEPFAPITRLRGNVTEPIHAALSYTAPVRRGPIQTFSVTDALCQIYLAVLLILACRLMAGLIGAWRLKRTALIDFDLSEMAGVEVRTHAGLAVPIAADGLRPCVILPAEAENWGEERLRAVLCHETAHLRRRDGLWVLLSNALCVLQWFNPLVWFVDRGLRADFEFLADDEVLLTGTSPSSYAANMLELAKTASRPTYGALASAFVRPGGIQARIKAILDFDRKRSGFTWRRLGTALGVSGASSLFFAPIVYAQLQNVANPTSWAADVKAGLTAPATPGNGFVGKLRDERKIEVVQITRKVGKQLLAWKPDGTPIELDKVIPVPFNAKLPEGTRLILIRIPKADHTVDMEAGLGSGPPNPKEPKSMTFAGGGMLPDDGGPYRYCVCYIELPKEDGQEGAFTLTVSDDPWIKAGTVDPKKPFTRDFGFVTGLSVTPVIEPKDRLVPSWLDKNPGPFIKLEWKATNGFEMADTRIRAIVDDPVHGGTAEVEPTGNYGGYVKQGFVCRYYLANIVRNVRSISFSYRTSYTVEILGVRLVPNP